MKSYSSSDYAGLSAGPYQFYYGYEDTFCSEHGSKCPDECDKGEWAFVATINGKEVFRTAIKEADQFDCQSCLLEGIALFIEKRAKQ